jgi:GR25 family glycosyltransferase involved in LPS biosynthesis
MALPCVHLGGLATDASQSADPAQQIFTCALHGQCTINGVSQDGGADIRSCSNCADHLAADPFGPNSAQMLRHAEDFLASIPKYPHGRYSGRGVVIAAGGERFFPSLYVTVRALRHVGCRLPIQVWSLGRSKEMPAKSKRLLAPYEVEFVDGDQVRRRHPARRLSGWELKIFATLHSPFEEVLFLDADSYPCRNPEFLFERDDYRSRGAIFWPDSMHIDTRLKWAAYGVPDPRRVSSIESGQFVINKALSWRPLNLAWFYNNHSEYYFRYCHGDKHTLEVAWQRCGTPYVMWGVQAPWDAVAYLQMGPDQQPLFIHRCRDKFRFDTNSYTTPQNYPQPMFHALLPLEKECWQWMAELARLSGQTLAHHKMTRVYKPRSEERGTRSEETPVSHSSFLVPRSSHLAVATLYTSEVAELGRRTSRVLRAYAERHGYAAVVATATFDPSRSPIWSKILLLERYLLENPECEWIMWIDADAVIMNPSQRLEDLVDDEVDFVVAVDVDPSPMNAGVFLVRNCPGTLDMLRRSYMKSQYVTGHFPEQQALFEALQESTQTVRARFVPRPRLNSFAFEYQEGDFILHFAGYSPEAKLAGVKQALAWLKKPHARRSLSPLKAREVNIVRKLLPPAGVARPEVLPTACMHFPSSPSTGERGEDTPLGVPQGVPPAAQMKRKSDLPPIYCITCAQTPERTARARRHFQERGLQVQFFPGIHGSSFGLRAVHDPPHLMQEGHVGVLLSHYMLWQTLAYLPHEEVLILEDDAWFGPNFKRDFQRAYADLPADWQFVFVGGVKMKDKPLERLTRRVCVMRYPCGTHAYLVRRSALPFLLQSNHEARRPLDLQLMENSLPAMKCYTFLPSLVKQHTRRSSEEGTGENWPSTVAAANDTR